MTNQRHFDIGKLSALGKVRQKNEDYLLAEVPDWVDEQTLEAKGHLFVVADGMGGQAAGQTASRLAVEGIVWEYYSAPSMNIRQSLDRAVKTGNAEIYRHALNNPEFRGMGSTVVAAVVRGNQLVVANVGDSRAYLIRGRSIRQITLDHSWVAESLRAGALTKEEASQHPYRNVITRSMGGDREVEVDLFQKRIQRGDVLLLCSDGLHGLVDDGEMVEVVAQSQSSQEAAQRLVEIANQRGGSDNITAIVVGLGEVDAAVIGPFSRRALGIMLPIAGGIAALGLVVAILFLANVLPSPTLYPAPTLVAPPNGESLDDIPITFTWQSTYTLGHEEYFAVEIWSQASADGTPSTVRGKKLQIIWTPSEPGQYTWDVVIVKAPAGDKVDILSEKSETWTFQVVGEP